LIFNGKALVGLLLTNDKKSKYKTIPKQDPLKLGFKPENQRKEHYSDACKAAYYRKNKQAGN
ncbi:MAG: hypothetical protein ACPK85_09390, partial [Methanosarcina sp.]